MDVEDLASVEGMFAAAVTRMAAGLEGFIKADYARRLELRETWQPVALEAQGDRSPPPRRHAC